MEAVQAVREILTPHETPAPAAFIGISSALVGSRVAGGSGWASADDWSALFASAVIAFNGISMLRPALHDLMDRVPGEEIAGPVQRQS